uniref:Uncharacterized protein n=1 Tax=Ditylum brightwellii TaxID=49249 RepID=A0A7S4R0L1_9STRA
MLFLSPFHFYAPNIQSLENMLESFSPYLVTSSNIQSLSKRHCWEGQFYGGTAEEPLLPRFATFGNPFLTVSKVISRFGDFKPQNDRFNSAGGDCMPSTSSTASSSCDTEIYNSCGENHESGRLVTSSGESNPCPAGECISEKGIKENIEPETKGKRQSDGAENVEPDLGPYATIFSLMGAKSDEIQVMPFATQSGTEGLVKFTSRLLTIAQKLPFIVSDVSRVLSNLYDLYFVTVFRLCAGNASNEKILLGLERCPSHLLDNQDDTNCDGNRNVTMRNHQQHESALFTGLKLLSAKKSNKRASKLCTRISPTIEADICSPLRCEQEMVAMLREFIVQGQERLGSMVSLDKIDTWGEHSEDMTHAARPGFEALHRIAITLENRFASAHSCLFVALLLDTAHSCLAQTIEKESNFLRAGKYFRQNESIVEPSYKVKRNDFLEGYAHSALKISPTLVLFAGRMVGVRAVSPRKTILDVSVFLSYFRFCGYTVNRSLSRFFVLLLKSGPKGWARMGRIKT